MRKLSQIIDAIKRHPDFPKAGMVLCHNGVVRATSRDGRNVSGLRVLVNHEKLASVLALQKNRPGIVDIQVDIAEKVDLTVGDDVMLLVVAGDIRENVIQVLGDTLNAIKEKVTRKTEFFISENIS